MDSFGVDPNSLEEVERVGRSITDDLNEQVRLSQQLIGMQGQLQNTARSVGRSRGKSAAGDQFAGWGSEGGDRFLLNPRKPAGDGDAPDEFSLSRHDVRKWRGLIRLAMGDVDFHTVKESVEAIGDTGVGKALKLDKLAGVISAAAGPAMIGQMVVSAVEKIIKDRYEDLQKASRGFIETSTAARQTGISEESEQFVRERSTEIWQKNRAKHWFRSFIRGDQFYKEQVEKDTREQLEMIAKASASPEFLRSQGITTGDKKKSARERMTQVDNELYGFTETARIYFQQQEDMKKMKRAQDIPNERLRKIDPLFDAQLRNTDGLMKATEKQLAMQKQDWNKE
jgi:hypothetical protein